MPYLVNGQLVTEGLIREEFERIGRDRNGRVSKRGYYGPVQ
jgi:hypothetical protein